MKILVVGNGSIGIHHDTGYFINNHTGFFLEGISKKHSVTFTENSTAYNENNNLQNFDLKCRKLDFQILPKKTSLFFWLKLIRLVKSYDFFYIFYPGTLGKFMALFIYFFRRPMGFYIRGQYYNRGFLDRFILRKSKFILTVSPSIANDLLRFCDDVEVIRPMISIEKSDLNKIRSYETPKVWNLLFVGRVEERKGIYELLEIAQYLKQENFKFNLNIVGGGDLFKEVKSLICKLNLQNSVLLHGLISDKHQLKSFYDKADVFIFTSHDEGFPRVLYEAMASGLPIFTTFVGGISGRMEHLDNCIRIPVKNSIEAGMITAKYLNNSQILKNIGESARKTLESIIDGSLLSHEELLLKKLQGES